MNASTVNPSASSWRLPPVVIKGVGLEFVLPAGETAGLVALLAQLAEVTSAASLARLWAGCPTMWSWLVASHGPWRQTDCESWLAESPTALGEVLSRLETGRPLLSPTHASNRQSRGVLARSAAQTSRLAKALELLWEPATDAPAADKRSSAALLLLAAAPPPRCLLGTDGHRRWPPAWLNREACAGLAQLKRGVTGTPSVDLALRVSRSVPVEQPPSCSHDDRDWSDVVTALARALARQLDFARQLEQEKLASMKQLAYGASHEINNPLANISTRAQTLLRDEQDPDRRQKLAAIVSQAFRAHDMISNMMLFAHPPALAVQPIAPQAWLDGQREALQFLTEPQGTRLQTAIRVEHAPIETGPAGATALPEIQGDPEQLAILLQSLVRNASEALGAGGEIWVSLELPAAGKPGATWQLSVADSGPGMSAAVRRHCFDPFYSGREAGRGLGFGLSKAWAICRLHGGELELLPREPNGLLLRATLPLSLSRAASVEHFPKDNSCKSTPTVG